MPEGTQYKKGDIIVYYRDDIKIVLQVEYVHEFNGKIFYVTPLYALFSSQSHHLIGFFLFPAIYNI